MAKFNPYTIEKLAYEDSPAEALISYQCTIPDWDKRGVRHTLIASTHLDHEGEFGEYRFTIDYYEWHPDSRVINLPLYGLNVQKLEDEVVIIFKATVFTLHPRMQRATAEMLEKARKNLMRDLRAQKRKYLI